MLCNFSHDFHRDLTQNPNHAVPLPKHNIQSIKTVPLCYIHTKPRVWSSSFFHTLILCMPSMNVEMHLWLIQHLLDFLQNEKSWTWSKSFLNDAHRGTFVDRAVDTVKNSYRDSGAHVPMCTQTFLGDFLLTGPAVCFFVIFGPAASAHAASLCRRMGGRGIQQGGGRYQTREEEVEHLCHLSWNNTKHLHSCRDARPVNAALLRCAHRAFTLTHICFCMVTYICSVQQQTVNKSSWLPLTAEAMVLSDDRGKFIL